MAKYLSEQKVMESEFFHLHITGKTKSIVKKGKGVDKELDRFISADELGFTPENKVGIDQNAYMFALIGSCKDLSELKEKVRVLYNINRESEEEKMISQGKKVHRHRLESIDEISLCVSNRYAGDFKMPTYVDKTDEYSVVPHMYAESYSKTSSYGEGSTVGVCNGLSQILNPYNVIRDMTFRLINNKNKYKAYKNYNEYYKSLLRNIRYFFERILKTELNAKINKYDALVEKYKESDILKDAIENGSIIVRKDEEDGEYYVQYKSHMFERQLKQDLSSYLCVELQRAEMPKLDAKYEDVKRARRNIEHYISIPDTEQGNEDFLIKLFEHEEDIFKYGDLSGNSMKFYVFLAQFANQLKLQEAKRIVYKNAKDNNKPAYDQRLFRTVYPISSVEFEIAARGSVADIVKLFEKYNQLMMRIGDVDLINSHSTQEQINEFDKVVEEVDEEGRKIDPTFQRVINRRNPSSLL